MTPAENKAFANGVILAARIVGETWHQTQVSVAVLKDCGITKHDLTQCEPNDAKVIRRILRREKESLR